MVGSLLVVCLQMKLSYDVKLAERCGNSSGPANAE